MSYEALSVDTYKPLRTCSA